MLHMLMPVSRGSMSKFDYLGANATSQQIQALEYSARGSVLKVAFALMRSIEQTPPWAARRLALSQGFKSDLWPPNVPSTGRLSSTQRESFHRA